MEAMDRDQAVFIKAFQKVVVSCYKISIGYPSLRTGDERWFNANLWGEKNWLN
jgi:hypothetical protein